MTKHLILALALAAPLAAGAAPPANVQQEVDYLLGYIGKSGCSFYRNGSWSDASAAESHIRMKFDFLARQDKIATAQEFIDKTASESSLTGQAYKVRCGADLPVKSSSWLGDALARFRAQAHR